MHEKTGVTHCLALDFGTKRIGVAIGQSITQTATPLGVIGIKQGNIDWPMLDEYINTWRPDLIVLGLPLNRDGERQWITDQCEIFAKALEARYQKKVSFMDERYSSQAANMCLRELAEQKRLKSQEQINKDSMAAVVILESWFRDA